MEKLDFLVRFWELRARHATLGEPLDTREQSELLALLQLVTSDLRVPEACAAPRGGNTLPALLIGEGILLCIELRVLTAGALLVASATAIPVGSQVVVRAADAVSGVEYVLPCKVIWVHAGSPYTMALTVDGIPTRASFDTTPSTRPAGSAVPLRDASRLFGWSKPKVVSVARRQ